MSPAVKEEWTGIPDTRYHIFTLPIGWNAIHWIPYYGDGDGSAVEGGSCRVDSRGHQITGISQIGRNAESFVPQTYGVDGGVRRVLWARFFYALSEG